MFAARPASSTFWTAYLPYGSLSQAEVWKKIGGNVGKQYGPGENSCAARVSYGLNYGGAAVESLADVTNVNYADVSYEGTPGDGKRYIVSAEGMVTYLIAKWGIADLQITDQQGLTRALENLGGRCAIFATPGHTGVLKSGYKEPHVAGYLPVDMWALP